MANTRKTVMTASLALSALVPLHTAAVTLLDQAPTRVSGVFSDEGFDIYLDQYGHTQSVAVNE